MDLSENIVAAMIGAAATVATAMFQLFLAFRSRKADVKPRKGSGVRSMLAVFLIMLGAAVAGFAYSELRSERTRESTLALQEKLSQQVEAFAASARRLELLRSGASADTAVLMATDRFGMPGRSEALMHVTACRPQATAPGTEATGCDAAHPNRVALCANVPARAGVLDVLLYARPTSVSRDWEDDRVAVDEDVGGARFVERAWEQQQGDGSKAVCANFAQWSSEQSHAARIVVLFAPEKPRSQPVGTSDDSAIASEPSSTVQAAAPLALPAPETQAASIAPDPGRTPEQAAAVSPQ
jgi:hypothetical protein